MLKGRTFQDRLLSVTWISTHHLHRGGLGAGINTNSHSVVSVCSDQVRIPDEEVDGEVINMS